MEEPRRPEQPSAEKSSAEKSSAEQSSAEQSNSEQSNAEQSNPEQPESEQPNPKSSPPSRLRFELALILGTVPVGLIFVGVSLDRPPEFLVGLFLFLLWLPLTLHLWSKRSRPHTRVNPSGETSLNERFAKRPKPTAADARLSQLARREALRNRSRSVRAGPQWMRVNKMIARYREPRVAPLEQSVRKTRPRAGEGRVSERWRRSKPFRLSLPVWVLVGATSGVFLGAWLISALWWGLDDQRPLQWMLLGSGGTLFLFWLSAGIRAEPIELPPKGRPKD